MKVGGRSGSSGSPNIARARKAKAYQIPKTTPRTQPEVLLGEGRPGSEAVMACHGFGFALARR